MQRCLFAGFVVFCFLACGDLQAKAKKIAFLKGFTGSVKVINGGKESPAKKNMQLYSSDIVKTGGGANAKVLYRDGSVVSIGGDTEVELSQRKLNTGEKKKRPFIRIIAGKIRAKAAKADGRMLKMKIMTSSAVAGIRGTEVEMVFNSKDKTGSIVTLSGAAEVATFDSRGKEVKPLEVGFGNYSRMVDGKEPMSPLKIKPLQFREMRDRDVSFIKKKSIRPIVPPEVPESIFGAQSAGVYAAERIGAEPPPGTEINPETGKLETVSEIQVAVNPNDGGFIPIIPVNREKIGVSSGSEMKEAFHKKFESLEKRQKILAKKLKVALQAKDSTEEEKLKKKFVKLMGLQKKVLNSHAKAFLKEKFRTEGQSLKAKIREGRSDSSGRADVEVLKLRLKALSVERDVGKKMLAGHDLEARRMDAIAKGDSEGLRNIEDRLGKVRKEIRTMETDRRGAEKAIIKSRISATLARFGDYISRGVDESRESGERKVPVILQNFETGMFVETYVAMTEPGEQPEKSKPEPGKMFPKTSEMKTEGWDRVIARVEDPARQMFDPVISGGIGVGFCMPGDPACGPMGDLPGGFQAYPGGSEAPSFSEMFSKEVCAKNPGDPMCMAFRPGDGDNEMWSGGEECQCMGQPGCWCGQQPDCYCMGQPGCWCGQPPDDYCDCKGQPGCWCDQPPDDYCDCKGQPECWCDQPLDDNCGCRGTCECWCDGNVPCDGYYEPPTGGNTDVHVEVGIDQQ